ncbi:MAG TPA: hypothetical protein VLI92_04765 [Candidatus Saccharimonadales bacterium]|nr:hypothetical protein [Candidatus Saccharimonadales bacterium]
MPLKLKNNLTIGLRYHTDYEKKLTFELLKIYLAHIQTLGPSNIVLTTEENDPVIEHVQKDVSQIITLKKTEWNFANPINALYKAGNNTNLLIISVGVDLQLWQLQHGSELLRSYNLLGVGWRIANQENDGSYIGRLSYNTCILHEPYFYEQVANTGGIPRYVENGVLGSIKLITSQGPKEIPIGGQEDLAVQMKLFKKMNNKKSKLFGHIKHYGVNNELNVGTGLDGKSKIFRKLMVASAYRNEEDIDPLSFMNSWIIV